MSDADDVSNGLDVFKAYQGHRRRQMPAAVPTQPPADPTQPPPHDPGQDPNAISLGPVQRRMSGETLRDAGPGERIEDAADTGIAQNSQTRVSDTPAMAQSRRISRISSMDVNEQDMRRRITWPRNVDGAYLPTARPGSGEGRP